MTDYVKMERDLQQFMVAVDNVKSIVSLYTNVKGKLRKQNIFLYVFPDV